MLKCFIISLRGSHKQKSPPKPRQFTCTRCPDIIHTQSGPDRYVFWAAKAFKIPLKRRWYIYVLIYIIEITNCGQP